MRKQKTYDRIVTVFSPEGRLYQVEYAMELVKSGAPIVGVSSNEGVVLAANRTFENRLEDPEPFRKIFKLDEHIGAAIAGFSSDARVLIRRARVFCQRSRLLYDEAIDIGALTRQIGDLVQVNTQHVKFRPFAVGMILAGVDETGPSIFYTDPSGKCRRYKAKVEGGEREEAVSFLEVRYSDSLGLSEAVSLAVDAVKIASRGEVKLRNLKLAVVSTGNEVFRRLERLEIESYMGKEDLGEKPDID
jgi:proteasome alpha subunit